MRAEPKNQADTQPRGEIGRCFLEVVGRVVGCPLFWALGQHNLQSVPVERFIDGKRDFRDALFAPKFLGIDSKTSKDRIDDRNGDLSSHAMILDSKLRTFS
jgi:hypothetical protein